MKQISINDELYINSRLQEIEIEKENIKKIYDYYFKSEEVFSSDKIMNLMVILNRRNHQLMEKINLEKRKFLNAHHIINHQYISALNLWINDEQSNYDLLKRVSDFDTLEEFVMDLLEEKRANDLLLSEVNRIMDEEKLLLKFKKAGEKRKKKRLLFKQKNAKMK